MAALTTARHPMDHQEVGTLTVPVAAATKIYKGGLVKITAAGYAAPCAAEAGAVFVGVATETVDNTSGAAGDLSVEVITNHEWTLTQQTGFVQADLGSKVYASTDADVSVTQGANEQQVGIVVGFVSASSVRVRLTPFV